VNGLELIHDIIIVLAFPPSESFKIRVNLLSLYGMCVLPFKLFFLELSAKIVIQFPSESKLLLIFAPYCIFLAEFKPCSFSDPAKSMINILAVVSVFCL
jgi:hypothetical protein